jgi:hypothetical protein
VHRRLPTIENDRAAAHAIALSDDGFGLGVLFRENRAPAPRPRTARSDLAEIESAFTVCR